MKQAHEMILLTVARFLTVLSLTFFAYWAGSLEGKGYSSELLGVVSGVLIFGIIFIL